LNLNTQRIKLTGAALASGIVSDEHLPAARTVESLHPAGGLAPQHS
jgi:hypothetical protein